MASAKISLSTKISSFLEDSSVKGEVKDREHLSSLLNNIEVTEKVMTKYLIDVYDQCNYFAHTFTAEVFPSYWSS